MRNIFKFLMMGLMMIALAGTATEIFAQTDPAAQQALYQKFLDNRKCTQPVNLEMCKVAISAGDEYLQKYGSITDEANKPILDYINKILPQLKKFVGGTEVAKRFDDGLKAKNAAEVFAAGKELLAQNPDNIDVMLILASVGYDNAAANPPVDTYNADAVNYAKMAIQKIEEGKPSLTGKYGAGIYEYQNKDFADGKSNALGWMNYTVGYILYNRQNQKKEALPYLYKSTQVNSGTKNFSEPYRLIGVYYRDQFNNIVNDRNAKIQANENKETEETRAALGMQYAYADRAIDAFAQAYKVANPTDKKPLMDAAKIFYKNRFDKAEGDEAYIVAAGSKPFVDPATPVAPVAVESIAPTTPTTGAPTTPATTTTPATATSPTTTTKPATTTTTAPKTTPSASPTPKKPRK